MKLEKCFCGCDKRLTGYQRKWHSNNCRSKWINRHRKNKMFGNKYGSANKGTSHAPPPKYRYDWIIDYCNQNGKQCRKYNEGFSLENIDGGCFGKNYRKGIDCYI